VAGVARVVVVADWVLTTPTAILQPLTGVYLMHLLGQPITARWLIWSSILYAVAIASWIPVVVLQMQMRNLVISSLAACDTSLSPAYRIRFAWWTALGFVALTAFIAIFYLMAFKPY